MKCPYCNKSRASIAFCIWVIFICLDTGIYFCVDPSIRITYSEFRYFPGGGITMWLNEKFKK